MKRRSRRKGRAALRSDPSQQRGLTDGLAKMTKAVERLVQICSKLEKRVALLERVVEGLSASSDIVKFSLPNVRKSKRMSKRR